MHRLCKPVSLPDFSGFQTALHEVQYGLMVFAPAIIAIICLGCMIQNDRVYIIEVTIALQVALNCAFWTAHMLNPKQCWLIFR